MIEKPNTYSDSGTISLPINILWKMGNENFSWTKSFSEKYNYPSDIEIAYYKWINQSGRFW